MSKLQSNSISLKDAKFVTINEFKKLVFEITQNDHKMLLELGDKYDSELSHFYNGKYYVRLSLDPWKKGDSQLEKLSKEIDRDKGRTIAVKCENYQSDDKTRMYLRFVKFTD